LEQGGHALFVSSQGFASDVQHIEVEETTEPQRHLSMLRVGTYSGPIQVEDEPAPPHVLLLAMPYHERWFITSAELKHARPS